MNNACSRKIDYLHSEVAGKLCLKILRREKTKRGGWWWIEGLSGEAMNGHPLLFCLALRKLRTFHDELCLFHKSWKEIMHW